MSKHIKVKSDSWGADGHSHSWLTYREIIEYYRKHMMIPMSGMVSPETKEKLDKYGIVPSNWCQWTSIKDWSYAEWEIENSSLKELLEDMKKKLCEEFHIWDFYSEEEKEVKIMEHADDYRIVFWFDN